MLDKLQDNKLTIT